MTWSTDPGSSTNLADLAAERDSAAKLGAASLHAELHDDDARLRAKIWLVWIDGGDPVGPVSADQIARGMRAGKVPSDARVKLDSDLFWSDAVDVPDVILALKAVTAESDAPPSSFVLDRLAEREYLVWIPGTEPVGPVSADQIARGIRAGKVPPDASVQRVGDLFARDALDEPEIIEALKYC